MVPWLTALKTVSEAGMEAAEFIDKALDVIRRQLKRWRVIEVASGTARW
jgi:hypothetical protein